MLYKAFWGHRGQFGTVHVRGLKDVSNGLRDLLEVNYDPARVYTSLMIFSSMPCFPSTKPL